MYNYFMPDTPPTQDHFSATVTSSRIVSPRATTVAYAATVTPDVSSTDVLNVGTLTGALTLAAPAGTPADGQLLTVRFAQDATGSRAITYDAAYAFGTDVTATDPSTANAKWERVFKYNAPVGKWRAVALTRGF